MDIREQIRHLREMGLIDFLKEKIPTMSEAELFQEFDGGFSGFIEKLFWRHKGYLQGC